MSAAMALIAVACGSDGSVGTAIDGEATTPAAQGPAASEENSDQTPAESPTADAGEPASADAASAEEVTASERANLFPDLDVVRVGDRGTINLAQELGGGDLPVLLWFWAPH